MGLMKLTINVALMIMYFMMKNQNANAVIKNYNELYKY